jgi:hypothetical protein
VLRLAFGLERAPARRLDWPWFLTPAAAGRDSLAFHSDGLWGRPWQDFVPAPGTESPLRPWRSGVLTHLEGFAPVPWQSGAVLRVSEPDPFLPSRLSGMEWLPDFLLPGEDPGAHCRRWPVSVAYRPGTGRETYTLTKAAGAGTPGWTLTGFRQFPVLWAELAAGHLDAALVEGGDIPEETPGGLRWYAVPGAQQIILRVRTAAAEVLDPQARVVLSQAVNREELAQTAPKGSFRAPRAFLEPVLPPERVHESVLFQFDPLAARQKWLALRLPERRLRLVSLAHPFLEPLALRLAGQWQKSLELAVVPESVDSDRLWRVWQSEEFDLMLDVVDLDDGSLNDLWRDALEDHFTGKDANPAGWERVLQDTMPYFPILSNVHWLVTRPGQDALAAQVCPGCVRVQAP